MQHVFKSDNDYDVSVLPFMRRDGPQTHITESYVEVPPALVIQDGEGAIWTLGFDYAGDRTGMFEYDVVRNARKTGEMACKIVYRGGKLRIFGQAGWRTWNGKQFI